MSPTFSHVIACPKCGRSRADGALACPRCGLVFANWQPGQPTDGPAPAAAALDARAQQLWNELQTSWTDEARHDAFAKYCASAGLLAPAGRHYRQRLDERPDDAIAARMQARIVGMATAVLAPARTPALPISRSRWFWWVVIACAIGGALAGLFFRKLGR